MVDQGRTDFPSRRKVLLLLMVCPHAKAQELRGRWSAAVGQHRLGGTWTARPHSEPDAAYGTWSLLSSGGKQLASGTWSARKSTEKWEGRWQAEVDRGGEQAGSWTARVGKSGELPLIDLFRLAADQIVAGSWQSDSRLAGTWSIKANR